VADGDAVFSPGWRFLLTRSPPVPTFLEIG
jgi:hypothetical protein